MAKKKGKDKSKGPGEGKGKGGNRKTARGKVTAKGKAKGKAAVKGKAKGKGEDKKKAKGKGKDKEKAKSKAKAKGKGKAEVKGKRIDKTKTRVKGVDKAKGEGRAEKKKPDKGGTTKVAKTAVPQVFSVHAQRRWKQVASRLGLEKHVSAVSEWDGRGAPPVLTGFSFVRHVESDARDLQCAGTSVTMTQGVIVKREDGKSFLTGRGVAQKFLGVQVPWKSRANTGRRFLTAHEREELGQPQAQGSVAEPSA